jgi:hypothetical protein
MFVHKAEAANLTSVSDLLTDSAPDHSSVHTISFTSPNGMQANQIFTIDFPTDFDLSGLSTTDISMTIGGGGATLGASNGVGQWGLSTSTHFIEFQAPTDGGAASSSAFVITVGDEAGTMITNPSATTSYEISIGTSGTSTIPDNGQTRVAIIENVYVSANINTTLSFNIHGTSTGAVCNGADATFASSTNTTLPFGNLQAGTPKTLCQDLSVATNAIHGYTVTVAEDAPFQSSTGADIDGFVDGSATNTPTAWAAPSNNVTDENTWGHWGLTSTDGTTTRTAQFSSNMWIAPSTTPRIVMGHDSVADGSTPGIGTASVAYKVEITALQEAGDDYHTTLTYVATPTF